MAMMICSNGNIKVMGDLCCDEGGHHNNRNGHGRRHLQQRLKLTIIVALVMINNCRLKDL